MGRWRGAGGRVSGQVYGLGGWVVGNSSGEWWLREVGGFFFVDVRLRCWKVHSVEFTVQCSADMLVRALSRGDPLAGGLMQKHKNQNRPGPVVIPYLFLRDRFDP